MVTVKQVTKQLPWQQLNKLNNYHGNRYKPITIATVKQVTILWSALSVGDDLRGTVGWVALCVRAARTSPVFPWLLSPAVSRARTTHSPTYPCGFLTALSGSRSRQHTSFPVPLPGEKNGERVLPVYIAVVGFWKDVHSNTLNDFLVLLLLIGLNQL